MANYMAIHVERKNRRRRKKFIRFTDFASAAKQEKRKKLTEKKEFFDKLTQRISPEIFSSGGNKAVAVAL